jgi:hypothetical protein
MKNEVLYFLAKMAVALAVVDAFIPRAEHYVKSKANQPHNEEGRTEETDQQHHHYTNRLTTELPDKDKMHLHPPHYNPPLPLQQHQAYPHTSRDQHMNVDPTKAIGSDRSGQYQEQEQLAHNNEKKTKIDTFGALLSHPNIESIASKKKVNQNFDFFRHP